MANKSEEEKIHLRNTSMAHKELVSEDGRTRIKFTQDGTCCVGAAELMRPGGIKLPSWVKDEPYQPGSKHDPRKGKARGG